MKDYYQILGVPFSATAQQITEAYRKLVFKYHPDRNPDPEAAQKFLEIQQAYEILSDPQKRREYDQEYINYAKQRAIQLLDKQTKQRFEEARTRQKSSSRPKYHFNVWLFLVALLLFIAIVDLPYGYYKILRVIVSLAALVMLAYEYRSRNFVFFIYLFLILIFFNPLIPIYLDKSTWQVLDPLAGLYFLIRAFAYNPEIFE